MLYVILFGVLQGQPARQLQTILSTLSPSVPPATGASLKGLVHFISTNLSGVNNLLANVLGGVPDLLAVSAFLQYQTAPFIHFLSYHKSLQIDEICPWKTKHADFIALLFSFCVTSQGVIKSLTGNLGAVTGVLTGSLASLAELLGGVLGWSNLNPGKHHFSIMLRHIDNDDDTSLVEKGIRSVVKQ